jgi:hypothetical protein
MNVGQALDAVGRAVGLALDLAEMFGVPPERVAELLTEEAVRRQNAIADVAEAAKFGGRP